MGKQNQLTIGKNKQTNNEKKTNYKRGVTGYWYHGTRGGGTWYNIVEMWWNLVPQVGAPVPSLHESVPIKISSLDDVGIPRTNF